MSKVDDYLTAVAEAEALKPNFDLPSRPGSKIAFVDTEGRLVISIPDRTPIPKEDALALGQFILDQYK